MSNDDTDPDGPSEEFKALSRLEKVPAAALMLVFAFFGPLVVSAGVASVIPRGGWWELPRGVLILTALSVSAANLDRIQALSVRIVKTANSDAEYATKHWFLILSIVLAVAGVLLSIR